MSTKWIFAVLLIISTGIQAATEETARVMFLRGTATATDPATSIPRVLRKNSLLEAGDVIETGPKGLMKIVYPDKSIVFLKSSTTIKIEEMSFNEDKPENDSMVTDVVKGSLRALTGVVGKRNPDKTKYNTTVSTIGIRGTAIRLEELENGAWSVIFDIGQGFASNSTGTVDIGLDQSLTMDDSGSLAQPVTATQDPDDPAQIARFMSDMSEGDIVKFIEAACNNIDESDALMLTSMQAQLTESAEKSMVATTEALSKCLPQDVMAKVIAFDSLIKADLAERLFIASLEGGMDIELALEAVMTGMGNSNPDMLNKVLGSAVRRGLTMDQAVKIRSKVGNICL